MELVVDERDVYRRRIVERGVGCSVEEAVVSQPITIVGHSPPPVGQVRVSCGQS